LGKSFRRNLKAVSPVIATIIIVAIAIVMAIAVAYWMLGLGGAFTRYEKLEFTSCYATKDSSGNFTIHLTLKNTGSAAATLDIFFFNAVPDTDLKSYVTIDTSLKNATLNPGDEVKGNITLPAVDGSPFKSGMSLELMIQTVAGKQYPKVVVLP
jgi:FlaG/FlaF family flagellin (archaellin)